VNRTTSAREPDDRRVPRLVIPLPLAPRCRDDQPAKVATSLVAERRFARRPAGSPEEASSATRRAGPVGFQNSNGRLTAAIDEARRWA
jgi:hypothetical protein